MVEGDDFSSPVTYGTGDTQTNWLGKFGKYSVTLGLRPNHELNAVAELLRAHVRNDELVDEVLSPFALRSPKWCFFNEFDRRITSVVAGARVDLLRPEIVKTVGVPRIEGKISVNMHVARPVWGVWTNMLTRRGSTTVHITGDYTPEGLRTETHLKRVALAMNGEAQLLRPAMSYERWLDARARHWSSIDKW